MKLKKRTRYFILLCCIVFGGYFLFPTVKWYYIFSDQDREEARLDGEKLKKAVTAKVDENIIKFKELKENDASQKVIIEKLTKKVKLEINEANSVIKKKNYDIERYNKGNTKDLTPEIKIKEKYTFQDIKDILIQLKGNEEKADAVIREELENYFTDYFSLKKKVKESIIKLGLDLQGGAYALVSLDYNSKVVQDQFKGKVITQKDKDSLMDSVIIKIENRINRFGLSETSIQKLSQQDKILISLPGVKEATELRQIIETVGILEFKLVSKEGSGELRNLYDTYKKQGIYIFDDKEKKLLPDYLTMLLSKVPDVEVLPVSSKDKWGVESEDMGYIVVKKESLLKNAKIESANVDQNQLGQNVVDFTLDDNSAKTWAIVTEQAAKNQDQIAIILDNTVLHSPSVREKIPNGRSQITLGDSPLEVLNTLALILRSGSLDVPLEISEENTVGASLGRDTIEKGVWAIFFGVIFVFGFMILYYSGGGLIANFTVVLNILLLMAGYSLFKATLTLPGIAGIILTVGMAVDANVIIYERIKEEFRSGKTFKTAVSLGFDRAFWTILDSNLTTFAAGIGLSIFGTGAVKGFAVSLCLGIVTTLFASLFGTRLIFESLVTIHEFKSIRILTFFNVGGAKK